MSVAPERPLPAVYQRPWAVGVYLALASLVGLAWSAPVAATVASIVGAYPRGDAEVFDPGAVMLLETLRRTLPAAGAIRASWIATSILASIFGLVALAFAIAQLGVPGRSRPSWALARAVRSVPTLVLVSLVSLVADVVVVLLLFLGGGAIARSLWPSPPPRDVARFAILGLVVLALLLVGVLHDLARVVAVMGPSRTYVSLRSAATTFWRAPGRAVGAYAWRTLLGTAAIVGAIYAGARVGERTWAAILASAFVHQLGLAGAGWLRLSWLAAAARMVRPVLAERGPGEAPRPSLPEAAPAPEPGVAPEESVSNTPLEPGETNRGNDPLA